MIWSLQFSNRTQACIVQADGKPVTGTMDWLAAQAIVSAHNASLDHGTVEDRVNDKMQQLSAALLRLRRVK